ncbi:hypothetical protein MNBD_GAMMA07-1736 [hydrothermal vent metagenome]|uniref:DUF302 domain-containing protein n=1 Tax=hydrothermal vent metagenome TaxID=652676 RepID=A0A3B0WZ50_9ZZZZ
MLTKCRMGLFVVFVMCMSMSVQAAQSNVFKLTANNSMDKVYPSVYKALEDVNFFVVFEPFISKSISRFEEKWGDEYNKNKLDSIRSMVFCNGWYANKVSNIDPEMLALCPLRIGLYEKAGKTTIVFARPTVIAAQSNALSVLREVESKIINAIKSGVKGAN